ncbi:beta-barrel assembly-enhancing protease [Paenalcaligenes niemegkensis]|uniref:beta-barrel assembly-enhancing protease n=1 Tax=Paenalcaligenes niemegkensis TaxID=2895469 RepID=UPI0035661A73
MAISVSKFLRLTLLMLSLTTALPPSAGAQPVGIPTMGSASGAELSPSLERTLGNAIMEQGRRDPTYIADPSILQYLGDVGRRLAQYAPDTLQQEINVFAVRDPSVNAFALPGGYIGIHSGLIVTAQTEAELASVIAHEIGHVSQRHVARGMTQSSQTGHIMMAALAGALLAALSGSGDLAMGVAAFGQAAAVDRQLGFSRQAEQEADRAGFQMLQKAGYDPAGMAAMFKRLMEGSRLNQGPGNVYASTHPLSVQRMGDIENRIGSTVVSNPRQDPEFWYVRAALRVIQARGGMALQTAVQTLTSDASAKEGVEQSAAWYGLAYAAWQRKDYPAAHEALEQARGEGVYDNATLDSLAINLAHAESRLDEAASLASEAWKAWPNHQGIALAYVQVLQQQGNDQQAIEFLRERSAQWPQVPRFQQLLAQSLERLGQPIASRKAMADYYVMVGALPTAVEQLQQARNRSSDFYEQSQLDVQIRTLRERLESERLLLERFRS